jgi:hypothetical protein
VPAVDADEDAGQRSSLLHNVFGAALKTLLYLNSTEYVSVVYVPWYLRRA